MKNLSLLLLVMLCAVAAWGQPDPNNPQPDGERQPGQNFAQMQKNLAVLQAPTLMESTPQGLFIYRNGVLAKFDVATMKPLKPVELFGAIPVLPADATQAQQLQYVADLVKRAAPAALAVQGNEIVIFAGQQLFCINAGTMMVKVNTTIPPINNAPRDRMAIVSSAPAIEIVDRTAFVTFGNQLSAVNLDSGQIVGNGKLPDSMTPKIPNGLQRNQQPGANPRVGRNQPGAPGVVDAPPAGAGETTLVGVVSKVELEGGFWVIETREGMKYVLEGPQSQALIGTPNIAGARVRLTGAINNRMGIAQYGNGYFSVTKFEVLPAR